MSDLSVLLLAAVVWTFCTGIAGLSFQTHDYWAHNAKYYDLVTNKWPLFFSDKNRFACYYFGYYLVPAFIAKAMHTCSMAGLFVWSAFGFFLGTAWAYCLVDKRKALLSLFVCFGGVGHTIKIMVSKMAGYHVPSPGFLTEIWSTFDQSLWAPNQVLPTLIVTGIFVYDGFIRRQVEASFLPITLLFIWAIFPAIILGILYLFVAARSVRYLTLSRVVGNYLLPGFVFLPTFVYLSSSSGIAVHGFIWQFEPTHAVGLQYCIGLVFDLALYYLIYRRFRQQSAVLYPNWFAHVVFFLFARMSVYRIGVMNDWLIRGSMPLVMIIALLILHALQTYSRTNRLLGLKCFPLLACFFVVCLVDPVAQVKRSLSRNRFVNSATAPFVVIPYAGYRTTYDAIRAKFSGQEADQYVGRKNSLYELHLARLP